MRPTHDLKAAIDAAAPGSTLTLCAGTWIVPRSLKIEKDLTLIGAGSDQSILDGGNTTTVLHVNGDVTVKLADLTVTRGKSPTTAGGLSNSGDLTLRNVAVTANKSESGGGLFRAGGKLRLAAGTRVSSNSAIGEFTLDGKGGGIRILQGSVILDAGSSVTNNHASGGGGGIYSNVQNAVTINPGSTVSGNTLDNCEPDIGAWM